MAATPGPGVRTWPRPGPPPWGDAPERGARVCPGRWWIGKWGLRVGESGVVLPRSGRGRAAKGRCALCRAAGEGGVSDGISGLAPTAPRRGPRGGLAWRRSRAAAGWSRAAWRGTVTAREPASRPEAAPRPEEAGAARSRRAYRISPGLGPSSRGASQLEGRGPDPQGASSETRHRNERALEDPSSPLDDPTTDLAPGGGS